MHVETTGAASIEIQDGVAEDGELEDRASISIQIPVRLTLGDGYSTEKVLFVNLDELPFETLPLGPVPLSPTNEDSTLYVLDRHREVCTTSLTIRSRGDGSFDIWREAELHLETGLEPFTLSAHAP